MAGVGPADSGITAEYDEKSAVTEEIRVISQKFAGCEAGACAYHGARFLGLMVLGSTLPVMSRKEASFPTAFENCRSSRFARRDYMCHISASQPVRLFF
jgi:hypothetical protein